MSNYTTPQEMITAFGAQHVAELGDRSADHLVTGDLFVATVNGGARSTYTAAEKNAADEALAVVQAAINRAAIRINSYLSRYTLPLSAEYVATTPLPGMANDIARYFLMSDADMLTDLAETRFKDAIAWLTQVAGGKAALGPQTDEAPVDTATAGPRVGRTQWGTDIDWDAY